MRQQHQSICVDYGRDLPAAAANWQGLRREGLVQQEFLQLRTCSFPNGVLGPDTEPNVMPIIQTSRLGVPQIKQPFPQLFTQMDGW